MQYKLTNKEEKTTQGGKPYIRATLTDTNGKVFEKINAFEGEFNATEVWHGELEQKGNFYNLITPKKSTNAGGGSTFMANKKTADIQEAQLRKEQGIAKAQDRAAWMYAKSNAVTLVGELMKQGMKPSNSDSLLSQVITLATRIYNAEPTEPFSAPIRSHITEPSHEFPHGVDARNHPLNTDAERKQMDDDDGLSQQPAEEINMEDIPF